MWIGNSSGWEGRGERLGQEWGGVWGNDERSECRRKGFRRLVVANWVR